jgi:hypothetical protein
VLGEFGDGLARIKEKRDGVETVEENMQSFLIARLCKVARAPCPFQSARR